LSQHPSQGRSSISLTPLSTPEFSRSFSELNNNRKKSPLIKKASSISKLGIPGSAPAPFYSPHFALTTFSIVLSTVLNLLRDNPAGVRVLFRCGCV
jgi:hypothetical protein